MVYDSNGFNFKGHSITEYYDTTLAGQVATRTSGFSKGTADIATLISPAVAGAVSATTAAGAYSGFGGLDFDQAFSSKAIPNPTVNGAPIDNTQNIKYISNGTLSIVFPSTVAGSATVLSYKVGSTIPGRVLVVGGGGGGGTHANGYQAGAGGGGGGGVTIFYFGINEDTSFNIIIGAGGAGGDGTYSTSGGQGGYSEFIGWGGTSPPSGRTYGGGGGQGAALGYYNSNGSNKEPNPSGSTGGACANPLHINNGGYAYLLNDVGETNTNATSWNINNRNTGGNDVGYGWGGAGGGGAGLGSVGGNPKGPDRRDGGNGGNGWYIWGETVGGGGGGGCEWITGGLQGGGGSGGGGASELSGADGTSGLGGGGGAGRSAGGGAGGSGVVKFNFG